MRKSNKPSITGLIFITTAFLLSTLLYAPPATSALSGSEFNPGRIIDDAVFYDNASMTTGQIQQFLDSKVPVCDTNGTQIWSGSTTRAQRGADRGYPPPFTCLKDYSQTVPAIVNSGSNLCKGSISAGTKTSAQIIYDVAQACGINPQVLIVLLQKEQALVTDDWPWTIQYRSATGYGCPDTAPCDAEYYGFFNQVYQAAKAFRRYEANPNSYNYKANRNNTIYYHPSLGACGSSNVFIENQATANLYIYTPYQPNASALNNLYGTGDGCSAYGNRNFWRMFNDWFGSTRILSGEAYDYKIESFSAYTDASLVSRMTGATTVVPGGGAFLVLRAINTGSHAWYRTNTLLGTDLDKKSVFEEPTWISYNRASRLEEDVVMPGQTGTFNLPIEVPGTKKVYTEYFNIVIEGVTWLPDKGLYAEVNVNDPEGSEDPGERNILPGQSLSVGSAILSNDKQTSLTLQKDGNVVLYVNHKPLWSSSTKTLKASRLTLQHDGNLVLYDSSGIPLWSTMTAQVPGSDLHINSSARKSSVIFPGQFYESLDRRFRFTYQHDGNLVLYDDGSPRWSSNTHVSGKAKNGVLRLQKDGNLVLYGNDNSPLWATNTNVGVSTRPYMQIDGNFVIYGPKGKALWATRTN